MEMILEGIIPYLPSMTWMASRAKMSAREYTRTLIESNSPQGMVLTVPVVGGSSATKRLSPAQLEISSHGDWTRIHLGAIEAAYGREPFFQHFFPFMEEIIRSYPDMLADMNAQLLSVILSSVNYTDGRKDLNRLKECHPERYQSIRARMLSKINPEHSVVEPLFRFGPDLIFLL